MYGSEWDTFVYYITYYWNLFITWFQALEIPAQVLVGIFLFFGVMAIAYAIYGALWITVQSIKFSILISGISIYLSFVILGLPLIAISGPKNIPRYWTRAGENVKLFVGRMYPIKSDGKTIDTVTYISQEKPVTAQNPPVVIIKEPPKPIKPQSLVMKQEVYPSEPELEFEKITPQDPNPPAPPKAIESFCPDCGAPFSERMKYVLLDKSFTFCEDCGTKIYRRN